MRGYDEYLRTEGAQLATSESAGDTLGASILTGDFDWDTMESLYLDDPDKGAFYLTEHAYWNLERARELLDEVYAGC